MALVPIEIQDLERSLPREMVLFLEEAEDRIEWYQHELGEQLNASFEPADYQEVVEHLLWIQSKFFQKGGTFLEWGSGFGVVAGVASMMGFKSNGVESDSLLVDQSQKLASQFGLDAQFYCGDFLNDSDAQQDQVTAKDVDLLYVYPWPGEVQNILKAAASILKPGAYLLCYLGFMDIQLFQKPLFSKPGSTRTRKSDFWKNADKRHGESI